MTEPLKPKVETQLRSEAEIRKLLKYLARQPGLSDRDEGWELALSWVLGDMISTPIDDDVEKNNVW